MNPEQWERVDMPLRLVEGILRTGSSVSGLRTLKVDTQVCTYLPLLFWYFYLLFVLFGIAGNHICMRVYIYPQPSQG